MNTSNNIMDNKMDTSDNIMDNKMDTSNNTMDNKIKEFEESLHKDLKRYLTGEGRLDEMLPQCPDLEELWPAVRAAYVPEAVKEYAKYPVVSLGWIMFIGMGLAKYWDDDWEKYSKIGGAELYKSMRDAKGFDNLDDYVLESVLGLDKEESEKVSKIVGECAARTYHMLNTSHIQPGTEEAAKAYLAALHQLYLMGIYSELNAMGYHMTKMG